MPQIIIHSPVISDNDKKQSLLLQVRQAIPLVLNLPQQIGQVILIETPLENRSNYESRAQNFVFIEVMMYPGRSSELRQKFADHIINLVEKFTGVDGKDINLVIHEISKENYYEGISHNT